MKKLLLTTALIAAFAFPALAQDNNNMVMLPDGHTALNISATENVEVEQDLLVASLRIQKEAKNSKEIQDYINKSMKAALEKIKAVASVKVETGQYYVHPDYRYIRKDNGENEQVLDKWRGSQTVTIKGKTAEDILNLAGELQDMDFMMNGLNYQLSPEKYEEIRDGLMEVTIKKLNERAKRVGKALGKENVDLVEINVDAMDNTPRPMMYARAEMSMASDSGMQKMAAPVAEAGESTVSMSISARAIIRP